LEAGSLFDRRKTLRVLWCFLSSLLSVAFLKQSLNLLQVASVIFNKRINVKEKLGADGFAAY
jgi:hypothetical protein